MVLVLVGLEEADDDGSSKCNITCLLQSLLADRARNEPPADTDGVGGATTWNAATEPAADVAVRPTRSVWVFMVARSRICEVRASGRVGVSEWRAGGRGLRSGVDTTDRRFSRSASILHLFAINAFRPPPPNQPHPTAATDHALFPYRYQQIPTAMDDRSRSPRWRSRPPKGPRRGRNNAYNHTATYAAGAGAAAVSAAVSEGPFDEHQEKFIGGAERARRNARKRQRVHGDGGDYGPNSKRSSQSSSATNNSSSASRSSSRRGVARIPRSFRPMDRFFASLFQSSVDEYIKSDDDDSARTQLMSDICGRAGLPLPAKISSSSIDAHHFYSTRASLVMEEARFILADALRKHGGPHDPHGRAHAGPSLLRLQLVSVEEREKLGATVLTFEKKAQEGAAATFTPQELYDMRPGCCFEIVVQGKLETEEESIDYIPLDSSRRCTVTHNASVLASVVPLADRSNVERQLSLMVYHKLRLDPSCAEDLWQLRPLTTVISEARAFEACTVKPNVAFMHGLLGWKDASHIRFDDSDDEDDSDDGEGEEKKCDSRGELSIGYSNDIPAQVASRLSLPRLNPTQERAAAAYLASPPSTLSLIQGPPGSGKTTFTVSCIIRCLFQPTGEGLKRRVLVTAPTNKAITVLASRFLAAMNGDDSFNVVLIGVEDKLVGDDDMRSRGKSNGGDVALPSTLRDIFIYTYMDRVLDLSRSMRGILRSNNIAIGLAAKARALHKKLRGGIPTRYKESGAETFLDALIFCLEQTAPTISEAIQCLDNVISCLARIDQSEATQELLANANVIFSTLSTAGVSAMKQTRSVTDLLVDEAAAATEPEICVPFHLRPDRMLAVGDPMQLPATIMSKRAADLGLNKSLHERLMYDCGKAHIMLDTQYRMMPDISGFPSKTFYCGKLMNGENVGQ